MKVAIVGSRSFTNYNLFEYHVKRLIQNLDKSEIKIVSGGAIGTDTMAKKYAEDNNLGYIEFLPDYKNNPPKIAPILRNELIAKECDVMIAFHVKNSKGTKNAIENAEHLGKPTKIVRLL